MRPEYDTMREYRADRAAERRRLDLRASFEAAYIAATADLQTTQADVKLVGP